MDALIRSSLRELESAEGVKIVYACESGSRAWGFPSVDSDYDVRFIYVRPTNDYLSINSRRDVIELPIDRTLDINGWDLRKALQLLHKSNPPLLEWLDSPVVYLEKYTIAERLRSLAREHFSATVCSYHYLHMAQRSREAYRNADSIAPKKYLYALRPVLALEWIERGFGIAPTDFNILVERLVTDPVLRSDVANLLAAKRAGNELDRVKAVRSISDFIDAVLSKWEQRETAKNGDVLPSEHLDQAFRDSLREVWHGSP